MTDEVRQEGFAPCPTCRQYSHSIAEDDLAKAFMHFETMYAHPMRGHPMGHAFDDQTRDAAQVLIAEARHASPLRDRIAVLEGALVNARGNLVRALASSLEISDEFAAMIPSVTMIDATLNGKKKHG